MWASTAIVSLGTATEGKNVLGTSTDIGLYAASMTSSPSMTTSNARNSVIFSILPGTGLAPASRTGSPSKASSGKATISGAVAGILGVGWLGMVCFM